MPDSSGPLVSVVLPTFNRAQFLPEALASVAAQTLTNLEVVVVDDGSTDDTRAVVERLAQTSPITVRYYSQPNAGPAAARNRGVDESRGAYIAFFDSDDLWKPHHLKRCADALESNGDVDWVYGSCQVIDLATSREIAASSFHPNGRPHAFLELRTRPSGDLRIIDDRRATARMISDGLMCGLQCSVLRRRVFDRVRLPLHRIGEDQIFVIQVLKSGCTLGYFDDVHAVYRVHDDGCSARASGSIDKAVAGLHTLVQAYEDLPASVSLTPEESRTLRRRLGQEWFWTLGYSLLWQNDRRQEALEAFRRGLHYLPFDYRLWKTYMTASARSWLSAR